MENIKNIKDEALELEKEKLEDIAGGEKLSAEQAWTTLPHSDSYECPHCGCKANKYMGTYNYGTHDFDLIRCGRCAQRFVAHR